MVTWNGNKTNHFKIYNIKYLTSEICFMRKKVDFIQIINKKKTNDQGFNVNQWKNFINYSGLVHTIFHILYLITLFEGKLNFQDNIASVKALIDEIIEFLIFFTKHHLENSYIILNDDYLLILNKLIKIHPQPVLVLIHSMLDNVKKNTIKQLTTLVTIKHILEDFFLNVSNLLV